MDATGAESRYRPFSNGTQFADWQDRNCDRCARSVDRLVPGGDATIADVTCDIQHALVRGSVGDGMVSAAVAGRMGYHASRDSGIAYCWPCPEFVAIGMIGRTPKLAAPEVPAPGLFDGME